MPRTKEANQRLREEQRKKILDGARRAFVQKGSSATMADIAASAGVSQGLAYRYFTGKEAIFQALIEEATQSGFSNWKSILEMPGTPMERLNFLVTKVLKSRRERIEFYQFSVQALREDVLPEEIRELFRKEIATLQFVIRQLISEGQATGDVAEGDLDQLVIVVIACLDGLSRLAINDPEMFKEHFPHSEIILRMLKL
jgi:AcrR family transcriptional regulator